MPRISLNQWPILSEIASKVGGSVFGDPSSQILGLCSLDEPTPGFLSFSKEPRTFTVESQLKKSPQLGALLVLPSIDVATVSKFCPAIVVPDPLAAMVALMPLFFTPLRPSEGIHPQAVIDPSARIGKNVSIAPFSVIGPGAQIGDDVVIHPHVVVYPLASIGARSIIHSGATVREECEVGSDCVIQNGAVVGADGFGYYPDPKFGLRTVPQVGKVILKDRVDLGANACVDRATLGTTVLGLGTKLDNLAQVGHNTKVGAHSIMCGLVGVGGSCSIGDGVVFGGQSGIADHCTVASGARFGGGAGVIGDISEKGDYMGYPAIPISDWKRVQAGLRRLPEILKKFRMKGNATDTK